MVVLGSILAVVSVGSGLALAHRVASRPTSAWLVARRVLAEAGSIGSLHPLPLTSVEPASQAASLLQWWASQSRKAPAPLPITTVDSTTTGSPQIQRHGSETIVSTGFRWQRHISTAKASIQTGYATLWLVQVGNHWRVSALAIHFHSPLATPSQFFIPDPHAKLPSQPLGFYS